MPRILAIDDSRTVLCLVEDVLSKAGYQVEVHTDPKRAVAALRRERFDLILTDIYMPEKDGLEVIQHRNRNCPSLPVVVMSGVSGRRNMLTIARHLGACGEALKPFSPDDLVEAVRAALGGGTTPDVQACGEAGDR